MDFGGERYKHKINVFPQAQQLPLEKNLRIEYLKESHMHTKKRKLCSDRCYLEFVIVKNAREKLKKDFTQDLLSIY